MSYLTTDDLPDAVKAALPSSARAIWREAFNADYAMYRRGLAATSAGWEAVAKAGYADDGSGTFVKAASDYGAPPESPDGGDRRATLAHLADGTAHDLKHGSQHAGELVGIIGDLKAGPIDADTVKRLKFHAGHMSEHVNGALDHANRWMRANRRHPEITDAAAALEESSVSKAARADSIRGPNDVTQLPDEGASQDLTMCCDGGTAGAHRAISGGVCCTDGLIDDGDDDIVVKITKSDPYKQRVFGWANVAVRKDGTQIWDSQQDAYDPEELEETAYDHVLNFRETGDMHVGKANGRIIESFVVTPEKLEKLGLAPDALPLGWFVGYQIDDSDAFAKVVSGARRMFSIQGSGIRVPVIEKRADAVELEDSIRLEKVRIATQETVQRIAKLAPHAFEPWTGEPEGAAGDLTRCATCGGREQGEFHILGENHSPTKSRSRAFPY